MWIRTQDRKNLCEVKSKIGIIHDEEDFEEDEDILIGIFIWDSSLTLLGEYKTKERALEVIDEIENNIVNTTIMTYDGKHYTRDAFKSFIYTMPIE
jgi:hypothetical protein